MTKTSPTNSTGSSTAASRRSPTRRSEIQDSHRPVAVCREGARLVSTVLAVRGPRRRADRQEVGVSGHEAGFSVVARLDSVVLDGAVHSTLAAAHRRHGRVGPRTSAWPRPFAPDEACLDPGKPLLPHHSPATPRHLADPGRGGVGNHVDLGDALRLGDLASPGWSLPRFGLTAAARNPAGGWSAAAPKGEAGDGALPCRPGADRPSTGTLVLVHRAPMIPLATRITECGRRSRASPCERRVGR
jgi:hypothetical protein